MARLHRQVSAWVFVCGSMNTTWTDLKRGTHLELSNIESIPKSETEPPEKVWFSLALVGTIGGSSRGPPGGDDYNLCMSFEHIIIAIRVAYAALVDRLRMVIASQTTMNQRRPSTGAP